MSKKGISTSKRGKNTSSREVYSIGLRRQMFLKSLGEMGHATGEASKVHLLKEDFITQIRKDCGQLSDMMKSIF